MTQRVIMFSAGSGSWAAGRRVIERHGPENVRLVFTDTLYEDVLMPVGFTHDPFFTVGNDGKFSYPWHRYFADTDCIWMAIELHPL